MPAWGIAIFVALTVIGLVGLLLHRVPVRCPNCRVSYGDGTCRHTERESR